MTCNIGSEIPAAEIILLKLIDVDSLNLRSASTLFYKIGEPDAVVNLTDKLVALKGHFECSRAFLGYVIDLLSKV